MERVEVEHNGTKLVGEVLGRDKWSYAVKLIEPFETWSGGCHIPTFARSGRENKSFDGERGDKAIEAELKSLYERAKVFFSQADRYQRIYDKDYLEELKALNIIEDEKIKDRIKSKLKGFLVKSFERSLHGTLSIYEEEWMLDYLKRNSNKNE